MIISLPAEGSPDANANRKPGAGFQTTLGLFFNKKGFGCFKAIFLK